MLHKENNDIDSLIKEVKEHCPNIPEGSLKMKMQNIKRVCLNLNIEDSFSKGPLASASKKCEEAVRKVLLEKGLIL